ncbi:MAG: hypothetical protein P4M11_04670 [Candidatus Pacebacteria bacterium]|nr:hypothetical protein [Candidatus Paceibacterota bacterium]
MIVYLNPILEYLTVVFHSDAKAFFELAKKVVYTISFCFIGLFSAIYLFIFIRFVGLLNTEIRQTREIVNMIPMTIIENNNKVRDQVWNHKGIN